MIYLPRDFQSGHLLGHGFLNLIEKRAVWHLEQVKIQLEAQLKGLRGFLKGTENHVASVAF